MKDWLNKRKIIIAISLIIIIAGLIILGICGFKKENYYSAGKKIEVYIPKGYEKSEIESIANESFNGKEYSIEKIEKLNQIVAIKIKNYTEDELTVFKNKIMEKYEIAEDDLEIYEIEIPVTRIRTLINPYIIPISVSTVIVFLYIILKSKKNEKILENVLKIIIKIFLSIGVYFSLILIFRISFNAYIMPFAITVYLMTLLISSKDI